MRGRIVATLLGLVCHVSFAAAVVVMFQGLQGGMNVGLGGLHGVWAVLEDLALLVQFPIIHSLLLSKRGRGYLEALFPDGLGKSLVSTTFVVCASAQLLVLFVLWSPLGGVWWEPHGSLKGLWLVVYYASWVFLAVAMYQAGLGTQMGYLGWWSVVRGAKPVYPALRTSGLYRLCRHPVYVAMLLVAVSGPTWTVDHAIIGGVFAIYCVLGPWAKERRYERLFGEDFRRYQRAIPFFPTPRSMWRFFARRDALVGPE